jgi:hypothetical protein
MARPSISAPDAAKISDCIGISLYKTVLPAA